MERIARIFKILFILIALLVAGVSVRSMYNRMQTIKKLERESKRLSLELQHKRELLKEIQRKVEAYKTDPQLLRDEATKRFLMIKKGETLIIFKKDN